MTQDSVIYKVVQATVESATKERRNDRAVWALKLKVPWSQYAIPTSMPAEAAQEIVGGDAHMVKFRRGRETGKGDGSQDYHYFWEIEEWDTKQTPDTPNTGWSAPPNGQRPSGTNSQDEFRRSKEEMRWTEALHMATTMVAREPGTVLQVRPDVTDWAEWFYEQIAASPAPQQNGASTPTNTNERATAWLNRLKDESDPKVATMDRSQLDAMVDDLGLSPTSIGALLGAPSIDEFQQQAPELHTNLATARMLLQGMIAEQQEAAA